MSDILQWLCKTGLWDQVTILEVFMLLALKINAMVFELIRRNIITVTWTSTPIFSGFKNNSSVHYILSIMSTK